jgi:hypothetical protein
MDYLGFYWTLPVNWAGFTSLPKDADEAAKASRTIRYQVERVRRWVKDNKGNLLREVVFMDVRPDRGTKAIQSEIGKLLTEAGKISAGLVLVDFTQAFGWRPHGPLFDMILQKDNCVLLPPEPMLLEGKLWDPVEHFRAWREVDFAHRSAKQQAKDTVLAAMTDLKVDGASYANIAQELNGMGVKTVNGRPWTADNVRKFMAQA